MRKLIHAFLIAVFAVALVPLAAFAQTAGELGGGSFALSPAADAGAGEASVKDAADAAVASAAAKGFAASALKDAFEAKLPGALCYSVGDGEYHVVYGEGRYDFAVADGKVVSACAVEADSRLPVYDTLAAVRLALESSSEEAPAAFATRGLSSAGDKGHGYYTQVASLAPGQPGITCGEVSYALTSAESAVNVFQLGYTSVDGSSVNAAIDAFHASGFHTLVFPQGEYRLSAEVYSRYDDRSYYGLDATLFTDGAVTVSERNAGHKSLWVVRGDIEWGKGTETYVATNKDGTTSIKKKDVFHAVRNVELNGIKLVRRAGTSGYNRAIAVRSAQGVTFNGCEIDGGEYVSGDTTSTNGAIVDFYGDYADVSVINCTIEGEAGIDIRDLCDHVDNIPESMQVSADYPTGGRNVAVRNSRITTHNFDEGLPIFAGNEEGLTNAQGQEYAILTHCLVENVTVENNTYTMLRPATTKQRVVSITCGYQDSPVKNARIANNTFDVYANSYVILFGWAEDCSFVDNDVTLRTTKDKASIVPVIRSTHRRTGPTKNVRVEGNTMRFPNEDVTVQRMVDTAFGADAVTFAHNDVTVAGTVSRVFDSTAASTDNTFHLNYVKHLYDRVGEVARNVYAIQKLDTLYESYDTNAQADMNIHDEQADIAEFTGHLLTFNGKPSYNGHSLTFSNCRYDTESASNKYRCIAYDTSSIVDDLALTFRGCTIPAFESAPYNTFATNVDGKVKMTVIDKTYENVAALRSDTALVAGDVVSTEAYHAGAAEGGAGVGGGVYDVRSQADVVFANATGTADGGRYIALENGLVAQLRLAGDEADTVDLYQYGARGDGAVDDAPCVRAALASGAAVVHVSAGRYLMASSSAEGSENAAVVPAGVSLVGDGDEGCLFVVPKSSPYDTLFAHAEGGDVTLGGIGVLEEKEGGGGDAPDNPGPGNPDPDNPGPGNPDVPPADNPGAGGSGTPQSGGSDSHDRSTSPSDGPGNPATPPANRPASGTSDGNADAVPDFSDSERAGVVGKVIDVVEDAEGIEGSTAQAAGDGDGQGTLPMYRLYNPYSGEHFYTSVASERGVLVEVGWIDEGVGWTAPPTGNPVYRLYNPYAGDHHYTLDSGERDALVAAGWTDEGVGWCSDVDETAPLYREYNPNEYKCNHNYTGNEEEHDGLVALGWLDEGIAWYGV